MNYRIIHNTTYRYATAAEACHNLLRLDPRTLVGQTCLETSLDIEPRPAKLHAYDDYFGNHVRSFAVMEPHHRLSITAESVVKVDRPAVADLSDSPAWNAVKHELHGSRDEATVDALQFIFDSIYIRAGATVREYATPSFGKDRPILDAAFDLTQRITKDFKYEKDATTIDTSVEDVLERRRGVCQDFAHLQICCLRSLGLAARYVSGYLRTHPSADEPRPQGADASHAWVSVFCPQNGWVDFDPTNGCQVSDSHIVLGWGRDFHDVSPVKGIVLGGDGASLRVAVEVTAG